MLKNILVDECDNGEFLYAHRRCDGAVDCADGSDEIQCDSKLLDFCLADQSDIKIFQMSLPTVVRFSKSSMHFQTSRYTTKVIECGMAAWLMNLLKLNMENISTTAKEVSTLTSIEKYPVQFV